MIPKFNIANGGLVRVLIHINVTKYLNFKVVDGSFVYNKGKFEKHRARKFFIYVQDYEDNDPKSHEGLDLTKVATREVIVKYGLEDDMIDFIGHALVSLACFQRGSPYIYPLYGLAELPQVEFDENGKAINVTSKRETVRCKKAICDPSYLPNKVKKVGKAAHAICIMSHPIPDTSDSHSMKLFCHIRKCIIFVSTEAKTDNPEMELKAGIYLLSPVDEILYDIYNIYMHKNNKEDDHCFISISYDVTTHFKTTIQNVIAMYSKIIGKIFDLSVDLSAASVVVE
ncbi:hypothetical protein Peur_026341 [Populus x canadensis]